MSATSTARKKILLKIIATVLLEAPGIWLYFKYDGPRHLAFLTVPVSIIVLTMWAPELGHDGDKKPPGEHVE